jgi:hypothetical protein
VSPTPGENRRHDVDVLARTAHELDDLAYDRKSPP